MSHQHGAAFHHLGGGETSRCDQSGVFDRSIEDGPEMPRCTRPPARRNQIHSNSFRFRVFGCTPGAIAATARDRPNARLHLPRADWKRRIKHALQSLSCHARLLRGSSPDPLAGQCLHQCPIAYYIRVSVPIEEVQSRCSMPMWWLFVGRERLFGPLYRPACSDAVGRRWSSRSRLGRPVADGCLAQQDLDVER